VFLYHFLRSKCVFFKYQNLSAPPPTPKLEGHPLSAVRDCLLNISEATLRVWTTSPPSENQERMYCGTRKHTSWHLVETYVYVTTSQSFEHFPLNYVSTRIIQSKRNLCLEIYKRSKLHTSSNQKIRRSI
jgi:uncharacterized protein YcgL (UPF0745 family)